jgi:hypothetical protein
MSPSHIQRVEGESRYRLGTNSASNSNDFPADSRRGHNLDAREMYCMYLRHTGFCCTEAASGADAVSRARDHRPDLILMDADRLRGRSDKC